MIELFLSTDGKHTVHVSADTPEQMTELVPKAKALYQAVLAEFGAKGQTAQAPRSGNGQAQAAVTPHCPMHQTPMRYRQGRLGPFWSCSIRKPDGRWCPITKEVTAVRNGQANAA